MSDIKYDVFLSFRGPDTREGFVNHLHSAFVAAGVSTFLDTKSLGTGQHIPSSLENGIRASRIGIPILSENFADSKWCLRELSVMVNLPEFPIFPVFYNVLPSDLSGDGGKLVRGLENGKESWSTEFIDNCKRALKHVSTAKGYCFSNFDYRKPDLIREVVKDVLSTLRKSPLLYLDTPTCFGFEWQVNHLQKLLKVGKNHQKVVKLGIHGMSGIGKTTLASIVCKHILEFHHFDVVCIVRDVRQRSNAQYGLAKVQQAMLRYLFEFESEVDNVQHGKILIEERLRGRNVLLLLDDIETPEQLEAIGGCLTSFGEGSRILITTTDRQILNVANVDQQYEVRRLQHNHALQLFTFHAFPNSSSPDQYLQTVCNETVSACEGHPFTLQVLAKELVGQRDKRVWTSMIEKLRRYPDPHNKLKTCYDSLDADEKEMFQDIACFFAWTEKETAIVFWEELKLSAEASLERLCGKHMISFGSRNELLMHSCFRYLGRALARQIHMEPRKRTRLFGDSNPESLLWEFGVINFLVTYSAFFPTSEYPL